MARRAAAEEVEGHEEGLHAAAEAVQVRPGRGGGGPLRKYVVSSDRREHSRERIMFDVR